MTAIRKGILGKKLGMSRFSTEAGELVPVTLIEAGPCVVLQRKVADKEGYDSVQLGFDIKRESVTTKPESGHFKKAQTAPRRFVKEIRVPAGAEYEAGHEIKLDIFEKGEYVDVTGDSIGKGFQGGMKMWNWKSGDSGHGSMFHRTMGSVQSGPRLTRITKGHHMPGHMGCETVTVQHLEIIDVDKEHNILAVKGPVPGNNNKYLLILSSKKKTRKAEPKAAAKAASAKKPAGKPGAAKPAAAAKPASKK